MRLNHIPAVVSPALRLEICGELLADVFDVGTALEDNVLDQRLVIDISRIFGEREILHIQSRCLRLSNGIIVKIFFIIIVFIRVRRRGLLRRLGGRRLFLLLRLGHLKLLRDLAQRSDKLDFYLPRLAKRIDLPVGGEFAFHLTILESEIIRVNRANRAEALPLMRVVNHLAAKNFTIIVERHDQCAAKSAERSVEVGLLIFGMILFSKHQVHAGLITEWLAPMCRHIRQLRLFAVSLEDAGYRGLHVRGGARLFDDRCRGRVARLEQRHIETRIEATGKHLVGLIRLAGFANHPTVLQLEFPGRAAAATAEHRAPRRRAPIFKCSRLQEHQPEEGPFEIGIVTSLFCFSGFLQSLARNRLAAEDHCDCRLIADCRLVRDGVLQWIVLFIQHQRPLACLGCPLLSKEHYRAHGANE